MIAVVQMQFTGGLHGIGERAAGVVVEVAVVVIGRESALGRALLCIGQATDERVVVGLGDFVGAWVFRADVDAVGQGRVDRAVKAVGVAELEGLYGCRGIAGQRKSDGGGQSARDKDIGRAQH